jgi:hypothetical protein
MPFLLIGMPESRSQAKPRILTPPSLITEAWLVRALGGTQKKVLHPDCLATGCGFLIFP